MNRIINKSVGFLYWRYRRLKNLPKNTLGYQKLFGIRNALDYYLKLKSGNEKLVKLKLNGYSKGVYLRKASTDVDVFNQAIVRERFNVKDKDVNLIIDLGAHIGLSAVFFANKYPNATIIAVEPEKENYEILEKNAKNYKNIIPVLSAVWNKETHLEIVDSNVEGVSFQVKEVSKKTKNSFKATTLQKLIKLSKFDKIDVLKSNIEGSEKAVFEKNSDSWLKSLKHLLIDTHEGYAPGCTKIILNKCKRHNLKLTKREGAYHVFKKTK